MSKKVLIAFFALIAFIATFWIAFDLGYWRGEDITNQAWVNKPITVSGMRYDEAGDPEQLNIECTPNDGDNDCSIAVLNAQGDIANYWANYCKQNINYISNKAITGAKAIRDSLDNSSAPITGPSALCNDGTYSYSSNRSGTCSNHGGVNTWY